MTTLISRHKNKTVADEVLETEMQEDQGPLIKTPIRFDKMVSTGSTLLDCCISGGRVRGGGLPGGIIVEIYGPSGSGKTALLVEICTSVQYKKGEVLFLDPEGRLDLEYSSVTGMSLLEKNFQYHRPDRVSQIFNDFIFPWEPSNPDAINVVATDSLAALSTQIEMDEADKMGMKRAKEFSEGLRKTCRKIAEKKWLVVSTNQLREGQYGEVVPGGKAMGYYGSVRLRVSPAKVPKITRKKKLVVGEKSKEIEKVIGVQSNVFVSKNSLDDPFRDAAVFILFHRGVDDIRSNLQYIKTVTNNTLYDAISREFQSLDAAVLFVEKNNLELELREKTIDLWEQVEQLFKEDRKPKVRF